jgi:hypothetical protein
MTEAPERLAALEARVARLDAIEAARTLLHDYAKGCDDNDAAAVTALFGDDAELWAGPRQLNGRDEISAFYTQALTVTTCHIVGMPAFDVHDSVVNARMTFLAVELGEARRLLWGTYVDRIAVVDGAARFDARRITIDGSVDL